MKLGRKTHEIPREVGFSRDFLVDVAYNVGFTSCFDYSTNNREELLKLPQEGDK